MARPARGSLKELFPEVAAQWHPTRNGDVTPSDVTAGSPKRFWWKCPKGPDHEWQTSGGNRTPPRGTRCPFCVGQQVSVTNSLEALYPKVADQWHLTRNGDLTPAAVTAGSDKRVWWKCPEGPDHEWQATLGSRTNLGSGCPCCSGLKVSVTNSLEALHLKVAAQWHPTRNGDVTPSDVTAGSSKRFWWK